MNIDLEVEPSPVPDREDEPSHPGLDRAAARSQEPDRTGHRREHDAREPRREFADRVDGTVRDVAAFRAVAYADLVTQRQPQLVDATKRLNTSDGFIHPKVCRGRLLSCRATAFSSARV